MKLALVTETFPPEINGVAMTLSRLVAGLIERDFEVMVIRPRQYKGDEGDKEAAFNDCVVSGVSIPRYEGLHVGVPCKSRLLELWVEDRPHLVHVATEGPLGWSAIRAARQLDIPVVSSFHTNFHSYGSHYGCGVFMKGVMAWLRYIHNKTLKTFAPSADLIESLKKEGYRNVELFDRGVDTRLFNPEKRSSELRQSWGVSEADSVAIYVGRVAAEKNIPLTLKAYRVMQKELPNVKLVIVGDGPARAKLEKENPDVIFAGMRRGEDLARHFASADVFLFASVTETFGNVVTEAMGSGLLVLAYDYAAPQRYILHGENGFLATYDDEADYLDQVISVARCCDRWETMRHQARKTAESISWDTVIDFYVSHVRPHMAGLCGDNE